MLADAIARSGLASGGTLSCHHHLRNGDAVMAAALAACRNLGLRELHLAASSLFPVHAALIPFLEDGTVTRTTTSYLNGPLADAISGGLLTEPIRLQTHGGRARAIEEGSLPIDLAVIAAPAVDTAGNLSGATGPNACGPLGYAMPEAAHARHVLAVTDHRTTNAPRICIPAAQVDQIAQIDSIGSAAQIASGTTARAPSAAGKTIAGLVLEVMQAAGVIRDGLRFQAGAGATSLAVADGLARHLAGTGVRGDFAAGGITAQQVGMLRAGLFEQLMDVQAFDLSAVRSYRDDTAHRAMSASDYASPLRASIADQLDVMILGAAEVDTGFNVNVTTTSDGRLIGGSGGHADTAEGARLAIVCAPLKAGPFPRITGQVRCITTPGRHIDVVVTEAGIAVNPARPDLARDLRALPLRSIEDLARLSAANTTPAPPTDPDAPIVATCEDRHGTRTDLVRRIRI